MRKLTRRANQGLKKDKPTFLENNKWVIPLSTAIAGIWFPLVVNCFGESIFLQKNVNGIKTLTIFGIISSVLVVLNPIVLSTLKETFKEKKTDSTSENLVSMKNDIEYYKNEKELYRQILEVLYSITDAKLRIQCRVPCRAETAEAQISSSEDVLCEIMSQMAYCLAPLLTYKQRRISPSDLSINIIYSHDGKAGWKFCGNCQRGLSEDEICVEGSTMYYLLQQKGDSVFFNSKQKALQANAYIVDGKDETDDENNYIGSIAGYKIKLTNNTNEHIVALLFISSYSKAFIGVESYSEKDAITAIDNIRANMREIILKHFDKLIRMELQNIAKNNFAIISKGS